VRNAVLIFAALIGIIAGNSLAQNFSSSPLIAVPGNNCELDILSSVAGSPGATYICWVNQNHSVFTLHLKELAPTAGEIFVVSQDSLRKTNPQVALNRYDQGLKIAWQTYSNGHWQIWRRDFHNDLFSSEQLIADSIAHDPQITMNVHRIAWVDEGRIVVREFYPVLSEPFAIDSSDCSSPDLVPDDFLTSSLILYEKGRFNSKQIYQAALEKYYSLEWQISQLSKGGNHANPRFGLLGEKAFQVFENNVWKIAYSKFVPEVTDTTDNKNSNYKNPVVFTYPIPTSSAGTGTPFFLAFDADSIGSNSIFIKTFGYAVADSLIRISDATGNNYAPKIAYLNYGDSIDIAIIWTREYDDQKQIWMARDRFVPLWTNVDRDPGPQAVFSLRQNYPNPFNTPTTIEYYVAKPGLVSIRIYNSLGKEIEKLVEEFQTLGEHRIVFRGDKYPSGIYFCKFKCGDFATVRSMLLLR